MCIQPSASIASAGLVGVVPVAGHHRVAAGAELAGLAALERLARSRGRRRGSRRAGGPCRRWRCGGGASRRAASGSTPATSRSCRSRWSPRPCACGRRTASSPRPGTASRPSRRCAATTGRSESKSGWPSSAMNIVGTPYSAVHRSSCTVSSTARRVERVAGDHHRGAVRGAPEVAHHHPEAVVEGHRDAQPVARA